MAQVKAQARVLHILPETAQVQVNHLGQAAVLIQVYLQAWDWDQA